jgi:hypothetical protein
VTTNREGITSRRTLAKRTAVRFQQEKVRKMGEYKSGTYSSSISSPIPLDDFFIKLEKRVAFTQFRCTLPMANEGCELFLFRINPHVSYVCMSGYPTFRWPFIGLSVTASRQGDSNV